MSAPAAPPRSVPTLPGAPLLGNAQEVLSCRKLYANPLLALVSTEKPELAEFGRDPIFSKAHHTAFPWVRFSVHGGNSRFS